MFCTDLYEVIHSHDDGTDTFLFFRPDGFEVPIGFFEGKRWSVIEITHPLLTGLIATLDIAFEPELGERIEVRQFSHTVHEPTATEITKLAAPELKKSERFIKRFRRLTHHWPGAEDYYYFLAPEEADYPQYLIGEDNWDSERDRCPALRELLTHFKISFWPSKRQRIEIRSFPEVEPGPEMIQLAAENDLC
jgi:hypothetical protein